MSLKRQHIFDDILGGGSSIYHSAILTCYSFDPFFYSSFFRPQLSVRGIINQLVLIDAGCLVALGSDAGAVGVPHGQGILDEYACFAAAMPNRERLDEALERGEAFIRATFNRAS